MNSRTFLYLFVVMALLAGCRDTGTATSTPTIAAEASVPAAIATDTPAIATVAPTLVPTAPPETPSPEAATGDADPVTAPLPNPTIFDVPWSDRDIFHASLIDGEAAVLDTLSGASVYHIDVMLSDDLSRLEGQLQVYYTNSEDVALDEVYFRLFPELADGSTIILNATVNSIAVQPTFELQDSAMRVPLNPALSPGQAIVIGLTFEVGIPTNGGGNYGTFAFNEDILALAHFYPMIPVYDDEGWNVEIAPESGDVVYADSSFYLVRVTAPAGIVLVASGVEIEGGSDAVTQTVTFAGGPMRDFYLAASEGFDVVSTQVGATTINSYAFPGVAPAADDVLGYAADALESYNARIGVYPYTELDIVTTPTLALGVEYPGIIAINKTLYDPAESDYPPVVLESTIAHEVGHQWFYAVVGNDQLDDPWLDESLTQYITMLYFLDAEGPSGAAGFRASWESRWAAVDFEPIPIGKPVAAYDGPEYSAIVYGRGPLFFEAMQETIGEEAFAAFLRAYYQSQKWGIATPESLEQIAEAACQCQLEDLFAEWVG